MKFSIPGRAWLLLLAVAACVSGTSTVQAQPAWPAKPVRIIVSTAAGGASDIVARLLAERLTVLWKQQVLVDNRPGGGGVIAAEGVARAAPDGYTLGQLGSTLALNPAIRNDLAYDTARDLRAILHFGSAPALLATRADFPASTPAELFALVKAQPGRHSYGSPGASTNGNRAMEALKQTLALDVVHIPYKSGALATNDLLGGQISMLMATPTAFTQHIKSGRLKAIATTGAKRFPTMPAVPSFAESGVPGYDMVEWWMMIGPSHLPDALAERINRDIAAVVRQPEFGQRLLDLGIETFVRTPDESARFLKDELARWEKSAKALGLKPE